MKKIFLLFLTVSFFACQSDDNAGGDPTDNFDRQAMLANWADNIIIPGYSELAGQATTMNDLALAFANAPSTASYQNLVAAYETAYQTWQKVALFNIGKAEEIRLLNNLNLYPTDTEGIDNNVMNGGYNLELPSEVSRQGFPALDYLLFGMGDDEATIVEFYASDSNAGNYITYIQELTNRINDLVSTVLTDWNETYRDEFVENSGNSATASVDKLVNDYIFYYEKHLRAGKVGIPAGVFSSMTLPENVEGLYNQTIAKTLLLTGIDAVQDFFNGLHWGTKESGDGMEAYLNYLDVQKGDVSLAAAINQQFNAARTQAEGLNDDFQQQVLEDNTEMLMTYDELQRNVVNLKVDMLQAFNINVDFVDADGD